MNTGKTLFSQLMALSPMHHLHAGRRSGTAAITGFERFPSRTDTMIGISARIGWFAMEFRAHIYWPTLNQVGSFVRRPTTPSAL